MKSKKCNKCGEEKPLGEFYNHPRGINGKHGYCKPCGHQQADAWRAANRLKSVMAGARHRAKTKGMEFTIQYEDLQERWDAYTCELSGVPLEAPGGERKWNTASLDRIDSAGGYTPDNVRIICWALNMALGPWGLDVYTHLAQATLANQCSKTPVSETSARS